MKTKLTNKVLLYSLVAVIIVSSIAPFVWMVISSISTDIELLSTPPHWIPSSPIFDRYMALLGIGGDRVVSRIGPSFQLSITAFKCGVINSLLIGILATIICVVFGSLAAYAFARLKFWGREKLSFILLGTRMTPPISTVIPLYLMIKALNLMDTRTALVIIYASSSLPITIWVMGSFFQTVPKDIEDAAMIDGCSRLQALVKTILPLSAPGFVAATIIAFLNSWNELFLALIFTQSNASKTLPKVISEFSTAFAGIDYGLAMTGAVIATVPPILLALLGQKYIVKGLMGGAVKG
ncbi:MAG TPA: carbohydrate ABC transporter permease [Firmicutes bacterium]|nr:carbohydrate ABC transporter permease [Bacillota bacterium]